MRSRFSANLNHVTAAIGRGLIRVFLVALSLYACMSWAAVECESARDFANHISQARFADSKKQELVTRLSRAAHSLLEVHEKLILVSEVKPELLVCYSPEINAKVIDKDKPIFVFLGLLARYGHNPEFLAAVLAHELGHLARDHAGYRIRAEGVFQYNAVARAREAYYGTGSFGRAVQVGQEAYRRQSFAFSREQEADADSFGTVLLSRAGFRPDAMIRMMSRFLIDEGHQQTQWWHAHPGWAERLQLVEPRVLDEEVDRLARSMAQAGDYAALSAHIDGWLGKLPNSGNAWFHKAAFLERLRSVAYVEAYERSLTRQGPAINRTDRELADVWLSLCVGLYHAGQKLESAYCSRFIKDSEVLERYKTATFGKLLFVHGLKLESGTLLTARDADGNKLITNVPEVLRARGLPTSQTVAPWRPVRFPPNDLDTPLRR